jgi:TolB-like protein/Flp pilus assembly protein TadD
VSRRTVRPRWLGAALSLASLLSPAAARANLSKEIQAESRKAKDKRQAAVKGAELDVAAKQRRVLDELAKAEQRVREAQQRVEQLAKETEEAQKKGQQRLEQAAADAARATVAAQELGKQFEEAKAAADKERQALDGVLALEQAAAKVAKGDGEISSELARAERDASQARAVRALRGAAAYLKGDDKLVVELLTPELVAAYPSSGRWLGLSRLRSGQRDEAFALLKAAPLDEADAEGQRCLGELASERGELALAERALSQAWRAQPGDAAVGLALGQTRLKQGRSKEALAPLSAAAAQSVPTATGAPSEATYLLAVAAERAGDVEQAERTFGQVVGAVPRSGDTSAPLRLGRSIEQLVTAPLWEQLPDRVNVAAAGRHLAELRLRRGDHEGAAALLKGQPPSAESSYLLGLAALSAERFDEAVRLLAPLAQEPTPRVEVTLALGVAQLQSGDASRARETFSKLASDDRARLGLALSLFKLRRTDEAVALSRQLLGSKSVGELAAVNWAAQLVGQGQRQEVQKLVGQGKSGEARLLVAQAELDHDPKASRAAAEAAFALQPQLVDALLVKARAEEALGQLDEAEKSARRLLGLARDSLDARLILARVYGRRGDRVRQAEELGRIRQVSEALAAAQPRRTLAVIAFDNNTGDAALDWLRHGVAEALVTDLGRIGSLTLVERTQVQRAFTEQKLRELGFTDPGSAATVGKLIGADALIVGQVTRAGDTLRLEGRLVEVATQSVLRTASAEGPLPKLFEVERRLALDLAGEYAAMTPKERGELFSAPSASLGALESAAKVRALVAAGRPEEARATYQRLLEQDPTLAARVRELQKSWAEKAATLAVVPLANASGRPEDQWIGVGLAEALSTDLRKLNLFLVERQQIERIMQERRLAEIFNPTDAASLGKLVGASMLVIGSYQKAGDKLRIDARLVDAETGDVVQAYTEEGPDQDLFGIERRLIGKMSAALKLDAAMVDDKRLATGQPTQEELKRLVQASSKLLIGRNQRELRVRSVAVSTLRASTGEEDPGATATVQQLVSSQTRLPVKLSATDDARRAGADVLVLGTVTRVGGAIRVDLRAVSGSTGEVVGSGNAEGDKAAATQQAAQHLLESLGIKGPVRGESTSTERRSLASRWWLWTAVGAVVAGGVTAGVLLGTQQQLPAYDTALSVSGTGAGTTLVAR